VPSLRLHIDRPRQPSSEDIAHHTLSILVDRPLSHVTVS
jgi:hypothetical protein